MRMIFAWAAMAAMIALAGTSGMIAATQKKTPAKKSADAAKTSTAKKGASTASSRKGTSSTSTRKGAATAFARNSKKGPVKKPVTWRNRQMSPSSDRYREIQSDLAARGYLNPDDATGTWNQASVDALKKFQMEQNIDSSGKINSLSLIALGLGPRRDAVAVVPKPAPPPESPGGGQ